MAMYSYTIRDAQGGIFKSHCEAQSEAALRSRLKTIGYTVNSITKKAKSLFSQRHKNINSRDIVNMCRQFSVVYGTGLNLMDCLLLIAKENQSEKLSCILQEIHDKIAKGKNIADAFSEYPKVFSPFFVNMLRAGETTGKFDYILENLAVYVEKQYELKRKIRSALTYPVIVLITLFIVVGIIMTFVVPAFSKVYEKLGVSLPGPTLALIYISNNFVYIALGIIVLFGLGWILFKKGQTIPKVRVLIDKMKLAVPVYHKIVLLKFLQSLNLALSAGIMLSEAIGISKDVAANSIASEAADMIEANIRRGGTITEAVKLHSFFTLSIGYAFAAGEQSGNIVEMLGKFMVGITQDVDDGIKKLITTIEPLVIIILSMIVGFVMIAIYLPIFDIMKMVH